MKPSQIIKIIYVLCFVFISTCNFSNAQRPFERTDFRKNQDLLKRIRSQISAKITGNIPYAKELFTFNDKIKLMTIDEIRDNKTRTINPVGINPGGNSIMEKDIRAKSILLGYSSLSIEEKSFSGTLDLTKAFGPATIAILVDDIATLKVTEISGGEEVKGPLFNHTYKVNGGALWNEVSYKEFRTKLPKGRIYKLELTYKNIANLTRRYKGKVDVDGISVYVQLALPEIITSMGAGGPTIPQ